jgi:enamine deaminase RidA (YjgF/YER057c/UK114 family)
MNVMEANKTVIGVVDESFSAAERYEMNQLGLLDEDGSILAWEPAAPQVPRFPIEARSVLNEAYDYGLPSSFTRGLSLEIKNGQSVLWLSGTSAVDEAGDTVYAGDFRAQTWRTYRNLTRLLESRGATWHDIVRTSCYLRDIERDYDDFNRIRTLFFRCAGLDPLPASTGIQARLCRSDLLIEIEAFAVVAEAGE